MTSQERLEHIAYLKRSLENFEIEPMSDQVLKLTLKWIQVLENDIADYDFWGDYPKAFPKDTKNWQTCQCQEGNKNLPARWRTMSKQYPSLLNHRHRIYRTLEQAIKELE